MKASDQMLFKRVRGGKKDASQSGSYLSLYEQMLITAEYVQAGIQCLKKWNLKPGRNLNRNWLHPFALVNVLSTTSTEGAETSDRAIK